MTEQMKPARKKRDKKAEISLRARNSIRVNFEPTVKEVAMRHRIPGESASDTINRAVYLHHKDEIDAALASKIEAVA